MTNTKLTLSALAFSLGVLGFSCGSPMTPTDAGPGIGGGGGGGATGGGGGGGGGGARTCDTAPAFMASDLSGKAGYNPGGPMMPPFNFATFAKDSATVGRFDVAYFELYSAANQTNVSIPAANYRQCDLCFSMSLGCDNTGASCAKTYLAQSGRFTVGAATKSPDAGTYLFTVNNVTYEEWDFTTDTARDAGCLTLNSLNFLGTWP